MTNQPREPESSKSVKVLGTRGIGPFITEETVRLADGTIRVWRSRQARKRRSRARDRGRQRLWQPQVASWWIAVLFMVGSSLFAIGSLPGYFDRVSAGVAGATFFVGSIFFTSAAALQFREARVAEPRPSRAVAEAAVAAGFADRIDVWATAIQLIGTVFFNISTFAATIVMIRIVPQERLVWAPDVLGSIGFLVASYLAYAEVCHGRWCWFPRGVEGHIVRLNLVGSIAFGISASAAYISPITGAQLNPTLVNLSTFVGAVGFFVGAALLIPERNQDPESAGVGGLPSPGKGRHRN